DWPRGPMARRLTTNQEIAGSIPAVVISLFLYSSRPWRWLWVGPEGRGVFLVD
ncbi:hypothetical protein BC567DRAFT_222366, partial [Phyllosticta citribraziliensis]